MNPRGMRLETAGMRHSEKLFLLIDRNREHLRKWLPWVDGVTSESDTAEFIQGTIEQAENGLGSHYAVFYNSAMAGMAGFHPVDRVNRNAEIGYWLGLEFTGKALATASALHLIREGFYKFGLNRMEIRCASGNTSSIAVAKRAGMVYEGTLREEEWLHDRYVDHDIYSILKKEFAVGTD